ncbi:MAG: flavocytochrome c [Saccharofermentanales bacterium]
MKSTPSDCNSAITGSNDSGADILVIGTGFAGLSAAIEAAEAGASVLVLEKMKSPGGNSIISDGGIAAPDPCNVSTEDGLPDSPETMYRDMMIAGEGLNHPALLRVVTEQAREALLWSRDYLGIPYKPRTERFGGHSIARCYTPEDISGRSLIQRQLCRLSELKVSVCTGVKVTSLLQDKSGRIIGVHAIEGYRFGKPESGDVTTIYARKAVIVAAGGFSGDVAFRMAQDPRLDHTVVSTNKPSATAEILKECIRIGANPIQLSRIQLGPWASPDEAGYGTGPLFGDYIVLPYGMLIDPEDGSRFVNELTDRKTLSEAILDRKHPVIGIADQTGVTTAGWDIGKAIRNGVVRVFSHLQALAAGYGIDPEKLAETVTRFNDFVRSDKDQDFNKIFPSGTSPIAEAPYYAMRIWPKVHYTMGGVQIDPSGRVIHRDQYPIQGLYAAEEVTGGVHGACRLGSCSITECLVIGRIAGKTAAREEPR